MLVLLLLLAALATGPDGDGAVNAWATLFGHKTNSVQRRLLNGTVGLAGYTRTRTHKNNQTFLLLFLFLFVSRIANTKLKINSQ